MALNIDVQWKKGIRLRDGSSENLVYALPPLDRISKGPGVYVFARKHGNRLEPLYIGQATNLRGRVKGQFNNLKLMLGIKNAAAGHRLLFIGEVKLKRGQSKKSVLDVVERALIDAALSSGADLLNKQGTKTKKHSIRSTGNRTAKAFAPSKMYLPARK